MQFLCGQYQLYKLREASLFIDHWGWQHFLGVLKSGVAFQGGNCFFVVAILYHNLTDICYWIVIPSLLYMDISWCWVMYCVGRTTRLWDNPSLLKGNYNTESELQLNCLLTFLNLYTRSRPSLEIMVPPYIFDWHFMITCYRLISLIDITLYNIHCPIISYYEIRLICMSHFSCDLVYQEP